MTIKLKNKGKGKKLFFKRKRTGPQRESFNVGNNIKDCYSKIATLQQEIALAKRDNNLDTVQKLFDELVRLEEARTIAVHRVVTNSGYRSKGLSSEPFRTNDDYRKMIDKLGEIVSNPNSYQATPLDRIYIPKAKGGLRPISIPSYLDRCLQALYKLALDPIAEETADPNSYGFRPIRNIHWAVGRTLNCLNNPLASYRYVVEVDVKGCFDNINHNTIRKVARYIPTKVLDQWLGCGYIERETTDYFDTKQGVPQGGVLSPTLANMALDGLEQFVRDGILEALKPKRDGALVRFADDMLYFTRTYATAQLAKELINEFLQLRGLSINEAKTKITDSYHESFIFVGFEFKSVYRRNRKMPTAYIGIPQLAISRLHAKIKEQKRSCFSLTKFIRKINPIIRGWANNYRFAHDFRYIARRLGYWIWKSYYALAYKITKKTMSKARHEKIHNHVMERYFSPEGSYTTWPALYSASDRKRVILADIRSYESVNPTFTTKAQNPYILGDRSILEQYALKHARGFRKKVLEKNNFCCADCGVNLSFGYIRYELHHKRPRNFKGKHTVANLIPLCQEPCHRNITAALSRRNGPKILSYVNRGLLDLPQEYLSKLTN